MIYQTIDQLNPDWRHTVIKFHLLYLTMTLLNNSVKLSSNLDITITIEKSGIRTPLLTQSFELLSGSIRWGASLQSSRLVQGNCSNPLKILINEK